MQNASIQFNEYVADGGTLYSKAKITLTDGTELNLNKSDFDINGGFVTSNATSSKSSFDIGMTVIGQLTLKVLNFQEQYDEYDFLGAKISGVYVYAELPDGTIESIPKGTYKVEKQTFSGSHITLVAYDKMAEFVTKYTGSLKGTAQELISAMATKHKAVLNTQRFNNSDFEITIPQDDKDYSDRDILQYICEITGNYARFDEEGYLVIGWYDKDLLSQDFIQAGDVGKMSPYTTQIQAGDFADMSDNDTIIEAGSFETNNVKNVAIIDRIFGMPTVDVDDVVITGIKVINKDKQEFLSGSEGYVITIENNPLTEGKEQAIADNVARVVVGMRFRPLSARVQRNPLLQAGDIALFTYKGNTYQTILTNVDFTIGNHTAICCGAKSPLKNSSLQNGMRANAVMQKAKAETTQQLSAYDVMVQQLTSLVTQSFGVFKTETKLDDGSSILYMHDKPQLSNSKKVWRMSAGVFTVTDDYKGDSTVWKAGLDASGNAVLNVLSVIGLNADWINTDKLSAISSNLGTVNAGTIQSKNYSKDNAGMKLTLSDGVWDSKYFKVDSDGKITSTGGIIGGWSIDNATLGSSVNTSSARSTTLVRAPLSRSQAIVQCDFDNKSNLEEHIKVMPDGYSFNSVKHLPSDTYEETDYNVDANGMRYSFRYTEPDIIAETNMTVTKDGFVCDNCDLIGTFHQVSSKRYKENIHKITQERIDKILGLNVVTYDYKNGVVSNNQHNRVGVIAEDTVNVIPESIYYKDNQIDSVDYTSYIPYLIALCQRQEKEIKELKEMLQEVKNNAN